MINCQNLKFSPELAEQRLEQAKSILGISVLKRILCFALYLLGAKRSVIASTLGIPSESAKTTLRVLLRDGLSAFEDRRQKKSTFLPPASIASQIKINVQKDSEHFIFEIKPSGDCIKVPLTNPIQAKTLLLTLMNSGLLPASEISKALGLTIPHVRELGKKLTQEDVLGLADKRRGQTQNYRITTEVVALLIQQFAAHAVTGKSISSIVLAQELNKQQGLGLSDRTIRSHTQKLGLPMIAKSLPELVGALKKNSKR